MKNLQGKRALVTGAAAGIGRAIALELAGQGCHLFLLDINYDGLEKLVAETEPFGVETFIQRCDLTQRGELERCVSNLKLRWDTLDLLVNNAGIAYYGPTAKMSEAQWDKLLGINLLAPIHLTRLLLPVLLERPEAHILNVCSIAGLVAGGRFAAYHVSKFGLVGFSEALRAEYGRKGLGVTALCPGPARTGLYSTAMSDAEHKTVPSPPGWICTTEQTIARKAITGIKRNRRLVLVSPLAHILYQAKRFIPGLLDAVQHISRKKKKRIATRQAAVGEQHVSTEGNPVDQHQRAA